MVKEIIDELMDLDLEPKQEPLWWKSTYKAEETPTLEVGSRRKRWEMPFDEVLDLSGYRFRRNGKGVQGTERTLKKGVGSWWRDSHTYRARGVSLRTRRERVVSHVFSTGLNGSENWPWSVDKSDES